MLEIVAVLRGVRTPVVGLPPFALPMDACHAFLALLTADGTEGVATADVAAVDDDSNDNDDEVRAW